MHPTSYYLVHYYYDYKLLTTLLLLVSSTARTPTDNLKVNREVKYPWDTMGWGMTTILSYCTPLPVICGSSTGRGSVIEEYQVYYYQYLLLYSNATT